MDEVQPITIDLVRELKQRGKLFEAYILIKSHQESIIKNKERQITEFNTVKQRKYIEYKKKNGLCVNCANHNDNPDAAYCKVCVIRRHNSYKKYYEKKKKLE